MKSLIPHQNCILFYEIILLQFKIIVFCFNIFFKNMTRIYIFSIVLQSSVSHDLQKSEKNPIIINVENSYAA